jgi:hypothetical protein
MGRFGRRRMEQSDRGDSSAVTKGRRRLQLRVRIRPGGVKFGSPIWIRFELSRAKWPYDRTRGRTLFSERSARTASRSPRRHPVWTCLKLASGARLTCGAIIRPQTARIALPLATRVNLFPTGGTHCVSHECRTGWTRAFPQTECERH